MKKRAFFPAARLARREDGAVLVVVALTMAVLLGFSALVIDMGALYLEKSRLQSALDAAALAGAQELPDTAGAASAARKYYAANGCDAAGLSVTFPDAETITCSGEQTVQTTFARVLGVERTSTRLLHATAIKTKRAVKSPFDYAVFQGQPDGLLDMGGGAFTVNGGVFSNGGFTCQPGKGTTTITSLETVSAAAPVVASYVHIASTTTGAGSIGMVDLQPYFDGLRQDAVAGKTFTTLSDAQKAAWAQNWQVLTTDGNYVINGDFSTSGSFVVKGVLIVNGNMTTAGLTVLPGSALIVNGNLSWGGYRDYLPRFQDALVYVTGDIRGAPGGTGTYFTGSNSLYAGGDMFLGGSGIFMTDLSLFYCQEGDLTVSASASGIYMRSILYAYRGTVRLESYPHIYGAVIGNIVHSFPAGVVVDYPADGLGFSQTEDSFRLID